MLRPLNPTPIPANIPRTWNMNQKCDYHQGPSHETDRCYALKNAIQNLSDNKVISPPTPPNRPSITNNPLPNHNNHRPLINCIDDNSEMQDPYILIHKIPYCNMLSWDSIMDDASFSKPKINIWEATKPTQPFHYHNTPFGRGERNGMEWKKKNILRIFSHFLCLEV